MPMIHSDVGGAGSTNWGDIGSGAADIFSGIGDLLSADAYSDAADLAGKNAKLTARMTAIDEMRKTREAYMAIGGQQADIAAAGFSLSGSAIDLMKASMQQSSLDKTLIAVGGQIQKNQFKLQQGLYEAQADAATASGIGGIITGGLKLAAGAALL